MREAGYSKSEARDKIGEIVLTEIYDILKEGKRFNEKKYQRSLEDMLQQCIDMEDNHHTKTEWDTWDQYVMDGYDCFDEDKSEEGIKLWDKAWNVFQSIIEQKPKAVSIYQLMEEQDYMYAIDGWTQDYEMQLGNARKSEERIAYCRKMLELFDWTDDGNSSCFRCGIADSLFDMGKKDEAFDYYELWLNLNYSWRYSLLFGCGCILKSVHNALFHT